MWLVRIWSKVCGHPIVCLQETIFSYSSSRCYLSPHFPLFYILPLPWKKRGLESFSSQPFVFRCSRNCWPQWEILTLAGYIFGPGSNNRHILCAQLMWACTFGSCFHVPTASTPGWQVHYSDHSLLLPWLKPTLLQSNLPGSHYIKLVAEWVYSQKTSHKLQAHIQTLFSENMGSVSTPKTLWKAHKVTFDIDSLLETPYMTTEVASFLPSWPRQKNHGNITLLQIRKLMIPQPLN